MCFYCTDIKRKKAKEDIVCYKEMQLTQGGIRSLYYPKDKVYKPGDFITPACKLFPISLIHAWLIDNFIDCLEGEVVYAYDTKWFNERALRSFSLFSVVKCIIPKGEYYWHDTRTGHIVATKLQIKDIYLE